MPDNSSTNTRKQELLDAAKKNDAPEENLGRVGTGVRMNDPNYSKPISNRQDISVIKGSGTEWPGPDGKVENKDAFMPLATYQGPNDAAPAVSQNTSDQAQTMSAPVGTPDDNGMGILKGFASQANNTEAGVARQQGEASSAADLATTMELAAKNHLDILRAPIVADIADAAKEHEEKVQKINSQAEASTRVQMQKVQDATDAAAQFQYKDFWASRSGFGTAMGILAQALGGAANGAAKQPGAPTALDRVIAQDLEFQKAQYSKLQNNVSNQRSLYQDMVAQTGSELAAETAFYNAHITKFNAMLAQAAQQNAGPQALADAQAAIAANQQKAADKSMQLAQMHNENQRALLGGSMQLQISQDRIMGAYQNYLNAHAGKANQLAAMGITGVDMSEKEADIFKQRVSAAKRADELANEMLENPSLRQDAARIQEYKLAVARAKSNSPRAPTKIEVDAVNAPSGFGGSKFGTGLNARIENLTGTESDRFEANRKDMWEPLRAMVKGAQVSDKDLQEHTEPDKK